MPKTNEQKKEVGNKREQILLAAVEIFMDKDFYQVTITEIAERAAVGKGTVYEYFPSKEDLFKESFSHCAESYLQSFHQHLSKNASVRTTMFTIIKTHLDLLQENRRRLYLLFNERPLSLQELQTWVIERRQELLQGITDLLHDGVELKEVRSDIDIEMAGRLFLALNYVVMGGMVIIDKVDVDDKQIAALLDIYWNGVGNGIKSSNFSN